MKKLIFAVLCGVFLIFSNSALAGVATIQGNPVIQTITGVNQVSDVKTASFNNKTVSVFCMTASRQFCLALI